MTHPTSKELALFAGGDVSLLDRWRIARHVGACASCGSDVEAYRGASAAARTQSSKLPEGLNWDRLAAEMTANIHVGLEAGECVNPPRRQPVHWTWRSAAVMASMTALLMTAWWLNPPTRPAPAAIRAPQIEIRTTAAGLELNENGNAMVLLHRRGPGTAVERPIIVSAPGTLRARYVDTDTGQITINNVYSE